MVCVALRPPNESDIGGHMSHGGTLARLRLNMHSDYCRKGGASSRTDGSELAISRCGNEVNDGCKALSQMRNYCKLPPGFSAPRDRNS